MNTDPNPFLHLSAEVVWLKVHLSARFDAHDVERWRRRLQAYLNANGLVAAIAPERIVVMPIGQPITPFDRGLVVGWLLAQPEVVFVHIERRARLICVDRNKERSHG